MGESALLKLWRHSPPSSGQLGHLKQTSRPVSSGDIPKGRWSTLIMQVSKNIYSEEVTEEISHSLRSELNFPAELYFYDSESKRFKGLERGCEGRV